MEKKRGIGHTNHITFCMEIYQYSQTKKPAAEPSAVGFIYVVSWADWTIREEELPWLNMSLYLNL